MRAVGTWLVALVAAAPAGADEKTEEFEAHTFAVPGGPKMPYRLLRPEKVEDGKRYPLVLVLHGWGERGNDNKKQLKDFAGVFLKPDARKKFPCFVLVPQAEGSWVQHPTFDAPIRLTPKPTANLMMAFEIARTVGKKAPVDADRIYLMGYSNGACGVWELLEREPRAWAAAVPMAGAGDPAAVAAARHVPIWAFHGAKDPTVPLDRMKELVASLRSAHGHVMFTVVPDGVHYDAKKGLHDPNLLPWVFAQKRGAPEVPFDRVAGPKDRRPTSLEKK